jgi:hypothetical protein
MKRSLLAVLLSTLVPLTALAANSKAAPPSDKPAASPVDPALEAAHTKEDIRRHRAIAAAHEAAAKCQESGKDEDYCNAELAKACKGIAYGKYCGMKHPD